MKRATFFREIYVVFETMAHKTKDVLRKVGLELTGFELSESKVEINHYTTIFQKDIEAGKKLIAIRLLPFQTLFEYAAEVKKLPEAVFRPKNCENWIDYFKRKKEAIEKGINALLEHMKRGYYRSPHFGLGKNHICDFVDWASTDLRKPFLHYLHKYKGKGDPRISRALINLLGVKEGETILDPFVGSGAFIADAPTMGLNAIGIEILNIGKLISEVKCNLAIDTSKLEETIVNLFTSIDKGEPFKQDIKMDLVNIVGKTKEHAGGSAYENIHQHLDKAVALKKWIEKVNDEAIKKFLLVLLSQELVEFSEKKRNTDIVSHFKSYIEDRYLTLLATKKLSELLGVDIQAGKVTIIRGDSTSMPMIEDNSIDGILTSPPYFDALDYIGNNKISIIVLGLEEDLIWGSTKQFCEAHYREEKSPSTTPLRKRQIL